MTRHPTTRTWELPPDRPPVAHRTNLRALAARPARFEHHLTVVARLGCAQLEIATASEPVYFAHQNLSDEYAVALPTGDAMIDAFPLRTFVADATTGADVGRYNHRSGDLLLHPYGYAHWPGKLRPPYAPIPFPPGTRRCVLSLVYCASVQTPPTTTPAPALPAGRKPDDVKAYVEPSPPLALAALLAGPPGVVGRIGDTELALVERPAAIAPPRGGWVIVLAVDPDGPHAACDLWRLAPGDVLEGAGLARALVLTGEVEPDPIPPAWTRVPDAPFAPVEDVPRGALPLALEGLHFAAVDAATVRVTAGDLAAEIPRYWLARTLFRVALHGLALGHVETYGGFIVDDAGPAVALGIRGAPLVAIPRAEALATLERLYRAIAPADYVERLT